MPGLYMWAFDPTYLIFVIPALVISIIAQAGVHSAYRKYSSVRNRRGMTGAEAAQRVLQFYGVSGVSVERVGGNLTDHFDPRRHVIRLSEGVYDSATIAAVGIAAHEAATRPSMPRATCLSKSATPSIPLPTSVPPFPFISCSSGFYFPTAFWSTLASSCLAARSFFRSLPCRWSSTPAPTPCVPLTRRAFSRKRN